MEYDELPPLVADFRHGDGDVNDAFNLLDYDCGTMLRDLETYTEDTVGNTHVDPASNVSPLHSLHSPLHSETPVERPVARADADDNADDNDRITRPLPDGSSSTYDFSQAPVPPPVRLGKQTRGVDLYSPGFLHPCPGLVNGLKCPGKEDRNAPSGGSVGRQTCSCSNPMHTFANGLQFKWKVNNPSEAKDRMKKGFTEYDDLYQPREMPFRGDGHGYKCKHCGTKCGHQCTSSVAAKKQKRLAKDSIRTMLGSVNFAHNRTAEEAQQIGQIGSNDLLRAKQASGFAQCLLIQQQRTNALSFAELGFCNMVAQKNELSQDMYDSMLTRLTEFANKMV